MAFSDMEIPNSSLRGKAAVVTGGGRGIGRAISIQLARKGVSALAITYHGNKAAADETAAQCLKLGADKVIVIQADILDPAFGANVIAKATAGLGIKTVDILVNNAALTDMQMAEPLSQVTPEGFSKVMQGNCFSAISIISATLPHLPARNGRIINISSVVSRSPAPDPLAIYSASKAALDSVTRSYANTAAEKYLATFNSVSVGATMTEAMEKAVALFPKEVTDQMVNRPSAEQRLGVPEDVALIVAWLASGESRWINGASVMANGGDRNVLAAQG